MEFLLFITGFIIGVAGTCCSIKKSEWVTYNPDKFIYNGGVIIVLFNNGLLAATRDRNDIDWSKVRSYKII